MSYLTEGLLNNLSEKFQYFTFEYEEINYFGKIPVFFIKVECDEENFTIRWPEIVDFIGIHFQTSLTDEFAVWNIYLFFICKNSISKSLKYKIENDTFSSRKIIIEGDSSKQEIINEHILNADLSLVDISNSEVVFQKNKTIWKALESKKVNKKISSGDEAAFNQIYNDLKKESNEN